VTTRAAVEQAVGRLAEGDPLRLVVIRGGGLLELDLGPRPPAAVRQPAAGAEP
jgi:hypothetical protein